MSDNLVKWLRSAGVPGMDEAADRIEKLEAALRPFAEKYLWPDDSGFADEIRSDEDWDKQKNDQQVDDMWIERGWIRAAREALEQTNG